MAGQDIQRPEILRILGIAAAVSPFPGLAKWAFAGAYPAGDLAQSRPKTCKPQFLSDGEYALAERLTDLPAGSESSNRDIP